MKVAFAVKPASVDAASSPIIEYLSEIMRPGGQVVVVHLRPLRSNVQRSEPGWVLREVIVMIV